MDLTFKEIKDEKDLTELSQLSAKIWNAYYPDIIGQKQVDYMLNKFHSTESLKSQIENDNHIFKAAYTNDIMVGYISFSRKGTGDLHLHKLYVNPEIHSKGIGRALFNHAFGNEKNGTIRLTVNRHNVKAINFYFKLGFTIEKIIDVDIGEGYVMNDFVMIYKIVTG